MGQTVADHLRPIVESMVGTADAINIRFWDGSTLGHGGEDALIIRSPEALRYLVWAPGELGLGRAYVTGHIDVEGDIFDALSLRDAIADSDGEANLTFGLRGWLHLLRMAGHLGLVGLPPKRPPQEVRLRGVVHSKRRDSAAISHHYDVGNDFYALVLGETMTYSCGYFETEDLSLDEAQTSKYDLICRKLNVGPDQRLLDIGCGWGGMVLHAASHYGTNAVGVTLSTEQARFARNRARKLGLGDRVEIRVQDYRDIGDGPYGAVASIGMFEHVGSARVNDYLDNVDRLLRPGGRFLNHAISRPRGSGGIPRRSFIGRYVFPDGELHEVGRVVTAMHEHGLEVRDVESLREHYARTLRSWVKNLEGSWEQASELVGPARARIWRLYMAAAALNFEAGRTSIHQVLGVKPTADGSSGMAPTRRAWI